MAVPNLGPIFCLFPWRQDGKAGKLGLAASGPGFANPSEESLQVGFQPGGLVSLHQLHRPVIVGFASAADGDLGHGPTLKCKIKRPPKEVLPLVPVADRLPPGEIKDFQFLRCGGQGCRSRSEPNCTGPLYAIAYPA